jgi:EAL domain-containing protein (putative c-di-GMP-specific phosphodiesterase class I)
MTTIGEGIEEESVAAELQRLGCDIGQGYHFARPLALPEVAAWVAEAARLGRLRGGVEPASTEAQITAP